MTNLDDLYNAVSRRVDTPGTKINVAETRRVISELFLVLADMPTDVAFRLMSDGLENAIEKLKESRE